MGELLSLDTLAPDRPTVRIDGDSYELKRREDFGLADWAALTKVQERCKVLEEADMTPENVRDLSRALRKMVRLVVLDAPDKVLDRLHDDQRLALLEAFVEATNKAATSPTNRAARRQTSASRRRASSASTKRRTR